MCGKGNTITILHMYDLENLKMIKGPILWLSLFEKQSILLTPDGVSCLARLLNDKVWKSLTEKDYWKNLGSQEETCYS